MPRDVSLVISAKDNYTQTILKMQKTQTSFRKDLGQLSKELNQLNQSKISLKTDFTKAANDLQAAKKAFKATSDEAARLQLEAAQANYDNIKSNLQLVSKAANQTQRDMQNLTGVMSKTETRANSAGGTLSKLAEAGLFGMLGNAAAGAGGALVKSAFGSETGDAITSILAGAATGAAMGSLAGGPVGTAVGAAVGAATGALQAATAAFENRDDAYRTSVQGLYEAATSDRADILSAGSGIAGTREQRQVAFGTLLKDEAKAEKFLSDMRKFAAETPFGEDQLAAMSRTLLAYNYKANELFPKDGKGGLLTAIGDAGSALGLTPDDMGWIAASLGKMNTIGKTTMEYLNPLLERGIPVFDYMAEATGKSNKQVQEMISKGLIPGQDAAKIIVDYMGQDFAGNMEKQAATYQGLLSTLHDMQGNADAAMGEGYLDVRKKDIEEQIKWYEGEGGKRLEQTNRAIGAYEASLVGKQEELLRNAQDETWRRIDELGIKDQETQGMLLAKAKADAAIEYAKTTEFQDQQKAQNDLINSIQEAMAPEYYLAGYNLGQNLTQGILAAYNEFAPPAPISGVDPLADYGGVQLPDAPKPLTGAYGFRRIPYDGFPLIAHQGEELRTAGQARSDRINRGAGFQIIMQDTVIREEADIDRVAEQLFEKIQQADLSYVGD